MTTTLAELIDRIHGAMGRAEAAGAVLPEGMQLATIDADGGPSVRTVLLKQADTNGLVFYTNLGSRKAKAIEGNPRAALCMWWGILQEQVLVEGQCVAVSDEDADTYFASRPRGSQIGAWASRQSEPLGERETLESAVKEIEERFEGREVPRPPFWSGYRMIPDRMEFWYGKLDRLHDRFVYSPDGETWTETRLYP